MRIAPGGARKRCLPLLLLLLAPACREAREGTARPAVVVSIAPLAWFVERLAGGAVDVRVLLPPGASPHSYEPPLAPIEAAARAALFVEIGRPELSFERVAGEALRSGRAHVQTVDAAPPASPSEGSDPHVWLSPRTARVMAARIADALAALPSLAADEPALRAREAALDAEIAALDAEIAARLAPYRGRRFFVYHPDWTRYAADYGLVQLTLESGHREPDARALRASIDAARAAGVHTIFVQPQLSKESAELVAGEIGARVVTIDPLARDWPGTLRAMTDALVQEFAR